MSDTKEIEVDEVLYVVNKYIKWKNAARKSYIRKKIMEKDLTDDITQFIQQTADQLAVSINNAQSYIQIEQMSVELKNKHTKFGITSKEIPL